MEDNVNPYNVDNDGLEFAANQTGELRQALRAKNEANDDASAQFKGIVGSKRRMSEDSDAVYGVDKEIYNFASAPQNAKSALAGNQGLQRRFD